MSEVKITDLVSSEALQSLRDLDKELRQVLETYTDVAGKLSGGLDMPCKNLADFEQLEKMLAQKTREASEATQRLNELMHQRAAITASTTNTISRQLMEQERFNKITREAYTEHDKVKRLLEQYHDTYDGQIQRLVTLNGELEKNKKAQKENEKAFKEGKKSLSDYNSTQGELIAKQRQLQQEKRSLNQLLTAEEKAMQSDKTAYAHMSQQLELLKKAYKELSAEGRESDFGKDLETSIQNLDAHLKDMAADMGEFQRNVGNYAITMREDGVVSTQELLCAIEQEAVTMQDVIDQTKILEEGRKHLDENDESYLDVLNDLNAQLAKNRERLADVSDIMGVQATTAYQAEEQNKRLKEAMKHIDLTSDGAQERIAELNAKIDENTKVIDQATPSTEKLAKEQEKLAKEQEKVDKANEGLADQMLSMLGINSNFASSLKSLKSEGNVWAGMGTKVKAFGKTLTGLLANPWVLAFLGIAGVAAAAKWWYDYNKGLLEATKLTKNFTGMAGDDMKAYRSKIQAVSDEIGVDFKDAIASANELVMQFGISWNEAAELMKDGYLVGANMHGKMLENINTYAGALKDAGVSAKEFIAIIANTKNGMFDERGLKAIADAGMRIRSMSAKTVAALESIGISSKKMQDDLKNGTITMTEAIGQVSEKLSQLPPNSQEVGSVMKDVFGKKVAKSGIEVAEAIGSIETNLDALKGKISEAKKLDEQRIAIQEELNETVAAMFDMTDGGFQKMTAQAKLYAVQGLKQIVVWCLDIANWFVRMYNGSLNFRANIESLVYVFKLVWGVVKVVGGFLVDLFKSLGEVVEGVVKADWDLFKQGIKDACAAGGKDIDKFVQDATNGFKTLQNNIVNGKLNEFTLKLKTTGAADIKADNGSGTNNGGGETFDYETDEQKAKKQKALERAREMAEKNAQEQLKVLDSLTESKIELMEEGHEKEIAIIKVNFSKKITAIKGHSKKEEELRLQYLAEMNAAILKADEEYFREMAKIDLDNRLASVKEGSKEELDLRLSLLQSEYDAEMREAKKTGANVQYIIDKFEKEKLKLKEEYANKQTSIIANTYANEASIRDAALVMAEAKENNVYLEKIKNAKGNAEEIEKINKEHEANLLSIQEDYAIQSADAAIEMLEKELEVADLTAEERAQIEAELAKAKADKEKLMADQAIEQMNRTAEEDAKLKEKRIANTQMWMQTASDSLNAVNDLAKTIFDAKIQKIEEEQEANNKASEEEEARITELVNNKILTEEQGEARKRAAQAKTAQAEAELTAKKQKLKERQAKWDRANAIAQAGIQTALAVLSALQTKPFFPLGVAMAAIAGALGAVQLATIIATPIPKYAKGTDYHKGGPAVVGDGGRQEVVLYNNRAWLTPDTPTVVDIPAGASVIPSVEMLTNNIVNGNNKASGVQVVALSGTPNVTVDNTADNRRLEEKLDTVAYLIKQQTKMQMSMNYDRDYDLYLKSRL